MAVGTTIALVTALGMAGASAAGQIKQGKAANKAAQSAAEREEFNAGLADLQAADAVTRGQLEAQTFRSGVRRLIGSQRAGYAGQNVAVGTGSAVDVQADAAYLGERDAQAILHNADREAWGYRMEAADRRLGADVIRRGGQAQQAASRWGAATTLLGTGSSLLLARYGWDRPDAPPGVRQPAYSRVSTGPTAITSQGISRGIR